MTEIETERLTLRRYRSEDAGLIHRLTSNARVFFWRTAPGMLSEFAPEAWGNGFATEAASAILDHGFRELHLEQIVAIALPDNEPSLRVIQRLAMPYIEDRMHANLTHRFFALTREAYISAHSDARQKA